MANDLVNVWNKCLSLVKPEISEQSYATWFAPIIPVSLRSHIITIQVPNEYSYEILEQQFIKVLRKAIKTVIGPDARLEYEIPLKTGSEVSEEAHFDNNKVHPEEIKNPFVIPGIKKIPFETDLNPRYTFDNFVEGKYNKLARSAGQAIAERPGFNAFNPLFVYGSSALGKTHLVHAIGNAILERFPNQRVKYISCEKFTNQVVSAIKNKNLGDFSAFYQSMDTLILDDIQFLSGKEKTQEVFFFIFNELHQSNKQLVMTCDRLPKDLEGMEERLISRFKWGLTAPLELPDFETRKAILQKKAADAGIDLPENVVEYVCYNLKNNIRELEGMLISMMAHASLNNARIDLALAREVILHFVNETNKEISIENIQTLVAEHFKITNDSLNGNSRKRNNVIGRQVAMYLSIAFTKNSLKSIGEKFGGKDHSTVIYSRKAVQDMMDTDTSFKNTIEELEKKIKFTLAGV